MKTPQTLYTPREQQYMSQAAPGPAAVEEPEGPADARMSEEAAAILWQVFEGADALYVALVRHYWLSLFAESGPMPHDPGVCISQILESGTAAMPNQILRAMRRIRNALHHRKHAEGSSVYLKDVVSLQEAITAHLRDPDIMNPFWELVIVRIKQALYFRPGRSECPACGRALVLAPVAAGSAALTAVLAAEPAGAPTAAPAPVSAEPITFQEYKLQRGLSSLKGRRIVVKLRSRTANGWHHGYFRSWCGTQVNIDVEQLGRVRAPINAIFYFE